VLKKSKPFSLLLIIYELNILFSIHIAFYYNFSMKKYRKTTSTILPEDEHLDIRKMSKTLQLNENINVKTVSCYSYTK